MIKDIRQVEVKGYQVEVFYSGEDEAYVANVPALTYCSAFGETAEEAIREIGEAIEGWLEVQRDEEYRMNDPHNEIKELVRERYGAVARQVIGLTPAEQTGADCGTGDCCGAPDPDNDHALRLYASGELEGLPAEAMAASLAAATPPPWPGCSRASGCWTWVPAAASTAFWRPGRWAPPGGLPGWI